MDVRSLSHYTGLEHLGAGGMGVVYKAEDTRLKRPVALKFLPPELTRDDEARQRFMQEARAASALDHPNICTIYEIDSTPEGQLYIAMAYYEGESLKRRLERTPLAVDEAVDIALQIARGLTKAHQAGIIHRDVKPANVMVTKDGLVKIVDFGIAKLTGQTGVTRTGITPGTVAYMAPEQISGDEADEQSDVWSLGAALYEMLSGHRAFPGDREAAVIKAILDQDPQPVRTLRPEVSPELERIARRALAKRREARYRSAAELEKDLVAYRENRTHPAVVSGALTSALKRPVVAVMVGVLIVATAVLAGWSFSRKTMTRRIREERIPELRRLIEKDEYGAALALAHEIEAVVPDEPALRELRPRIAVRRSIDTDPPGADVSIKGYADVDGPWTRVGHTPIGSAELPFGVFRWKLEKEGYDQQEFILASQFIPPTGQKFSLSARGRVTANMVVIPRSNLALTLTGYNEFASIPADEFLIDRFEVTNRQFKEFVDAGGYGRREYWKHGFVSGGRIIPWDQAMAEFRDRTGRAGPSTWEVGTYPSGQEDYPVAGVSWYEAAAYAEFAGKALPTVYHWLRAAGIGLGAYITPLSNLEGKGPAPVGRNRGVGPFGTFDMAGNVKEWCWNEMAGESTRYILGGSWNDPSYMFIFADARLPFDRSETNGFRLVKYPDAKPLDEALIRPLEAPARDFGKEAPVSDEVFKAFKDAYSYDPLALDAKSESVGDFEQWVKEKISFRAAYGNERITAYLFLPKSVKPPYQTVVYFPNAPAVTTPSSETLVNMGIIDFLMISGRAVMYPVYKGTYERNAGRTSIWPEANQGYRNWIVQIVSDARRSVDYLESRTDIRRDQIGYFGQSWGGILGSIMLAVEPRFKAAVFLSSGFYAARTPPAVDPFNFAPRVAVPVLMLNGEIDYITPLNTAQLPLYARLGTVTKRHRIFPGGHGSFWTNSRSQMVKESLDWLDRYLGLVN